MLNSDEVAAYVRFRAQTKRLRRHQLEQGRGAVNLTPILGPDGQIQPEPEDIQAVVRDLLG